MVDSVNSSLVSTQLLRGNVEAVSVAAQPPVEAPPRVPEAPFVDRIVVDYDFDKAVIEVRDRDTGDVSEQFPSESRLAEQSRAQARRERTQQASEPVSNVNVEAAQSSERGSTADIITVQDVTSNPSANAAIPSPQIAVAALSAGAQSGQAAQQATNVSVLA